MQSETASCFGIVKGFMSFMAGTSIARHFYLFSASLRTNYEENEENLMDLIRGVICWRLTLWSVLGLYVLFAPTDSWWSHEKNEDEPSCPASNTDGSNATVLPNDADFPRIRRTLRSSYVLTSLFFIKQTKWKVKTNITTETKQWTRKDQALVEQILRAVSFIRPCKPRGQSVGIGEGKVGTYPLWWDYLRNWYGQRFLRWTGDKTAAVTSLERNI